MFWLRLPLLEDSLLWRRCRAAVGNEELVVRPSAAGAASGSLLWVSSHPPAGQREGAHGVSKSVHFH